jgi:hypothetical protein
MQESWFGPNPPVQPTGGLVSRFQGAGGFGRRRLSFVVGNRRSCRP